MMQTVEWLAMRMMVPKDWEIVRHSVKPEKGRLVFVDHRQQRLQLSWISVPHAPDMKRAMSDYRAQDLDEVPETHFDDLPRVNSWKGFRRIRENAVLTRAGLYHARLKRWVEVSVFWPDGVDAKQERALLEGFTITDSPNVPNRLRAFGIDLETPRDWGLESAEVKPAAVTLTLRSGKKKLKVRRLGMLDAWFDGNIEAFLETDIKQKDCPITPLRHNGHSACEAESVDARNTVSKWLHLGRMRSDLVWVCPAAHALFQMTVSTPLQQTSEFAEPDTMTLRCCQNAGGGL